MTELQDELGKALERAGVSREAADEGAAVALREERRLDEQAHSRAYALATGLRDRDCFNDPLRFDEAVEVYGMVRQLCRFGRCKRVASRDTDLRKRLICYWLGILTDCGLPVMSHPDDQKTGEDLGDDKRKKSLAMAMAQATGNGESTIKAAWSEIVQTKKNEEEGWTRHGFVFTKWLPR